MNYIIDNTSSSCYSRVDPILSPGPATVAVEKLNFYPEREWKRVRLLSEGNEDGDDQVDDGFYQSFDVLQKAKSEGRTDESFDMTILARITQSIAGGRSIEANTITCRTSPPPPPPPPSNLKEFFSIIAKKRNRDMIANEQRRLVRCIAWGSRLAQLDTSSSVTIHERSCSAIFTSPEARI